MLCVLAVSLYHIRFLIGKPNGCCDATGMYTSPITDPTLNTQPNAAYEAEGRNKTTRVFCMLGEFHLATPINDGFAA
jgi:hypothetical protein